MMNDIQTNSDIISIIKNEPEIKHLRPKIDESSITWRDLRRDAFWQSIPGWKDVDY
jgi:hypothetical protein